MQTTNWNPSPPGSPRYVAIQQTAKAELHLHAGGAFPLHYLFEIASDTQRIELTQFINQLKTGMQYEQVFSVFPLVSRIINTNKKVEDGIYHICKSLEADGVRIAEIRSGLKKLDGETEEAYLLALLRGIERATSTRFTACAMLSIQRDSSAEFVEKTIELAIAYKSKGVVGIDISGISTKGDIRPHLEVLKRARSEGLFITAHIGESYDEKDQMLILEELKPHRIGHGVCLIPEAVDWIKTHKTPVEVCPTSALLVKMHSKDVVHPWVLAYRDENHPIVICTDDPTVFGVSPSDEYYSLRDLLSIDQITTLAKSSLTHSFMNCSASAKHASLKS